MGQQFSFTGSTSKMEAMTINSNTDKIAFDKSDICPMILTDQLLPKLKEIIKCPRTCSSSLHLFASVSDGYLITQLLFSVIPCCVTLFKFCVMPAGIPRLMPAPAVCPRALAW